MKIIPAIDIIDGKCVRLAQGDYSRKTVYDEDPLSVARKFEEAGIGYLHLVDLDGARTGAVVNWKIAEQVARQTSLRVDFGGGVKTSAQIRTLLDIGIRQVNLGSVAVSQPQLVSDWLEEFGAGKIILSADVSNEKIQTHGWQEASALTVVDFIAGYPSREINFSCTDIGRDGMLAGPNIHLYRKLLEAFPGIRLIASGGVSTLGDLRTLEKLGVDGTIIGKAIYENRISLAELAAWGQDGDGKPDDRT